MKTGWGGCGCGCGCGSSSTSTPSHHTTPHHTTPHHTTPTLTPSTLLLVCPRNLRVLKYLKVLLGTYKVLGRVPCWKASSKWVLEGTDQVLNWVLLHSIFRYPVAKITVFWRSNLIFDVFHFCFSQRNLWHFSNSKNSSRPNFGIWPGLSWSDLHQTT
jgi:hypothetical protein